MINDIEIQRLVFKRELDKALDAYAEWYKHCNTLPEGDPEGKSELLSAYEELQKAKDNLIFWMEEESSLYRMAR